MRINYKTRNLAPVQLGILCNNAYATSKIVVRIVILNVQSILPIKAIFNKLKLIREYAKN